MDISGGKILGSLEIEGNLIVNGQGGVAGDTLPLGTIQEYAGNEIPNSWLLCDGSAISRIAYADLFEVIGTTYGEGDGSTTFNLPDLKGKTIVGLDEDDTDFNKLGKIGGEKEHILTIEEMPSHRHPTRYGDTEGGDGSGYRFSNTLATSTQIVESAGGNQAHNNLQPYIVFNYIIKASKTIATIIKTDTAEIIDNLTSKSTTDALSANQGRVLNEQLKRKLLTAYIDRKSFTFSESWGIVNLSPFDSYVSNTDKLIVTDSGIVIGKGVSKVLCSAQCGGIDNSALGGDKNFHIRKNDTTIVKTAYSGNSGVWTPFSIVPQLVKCQEGDVFTITCASGGTGTGELIGEALTIEIIE